jgi:hypothetical protein
MTSKIKCLLGLILGLTSALASCAASETIDYSGPITLENVVPVIKALDEGRRYKLRIRSLGGDVEASILLAEAVEKSGTPVIAYDYCGSGCTIVFIASRSRKTEPGTLLLFHWSVSSHARVLGVKLGGTHQDALRFSRLAKREQDLYRANGISLALLDDSARLVNQICVSAEEKAGHMEPVGLSEFGYVSFARADLLSYGFRGKELRGVITAEFGNRHKIPPRPEWNFNIALAGNVKTKPFQVPRDCTEMELRR